jgi:hypothetical protein
MRLLSNTIIFYCDFEVNESEKLGKGQNFSGCSSCLEDFWKLRGRDTSRGRNGRKPEE